MEIRGWIRLLMMAALVAATLSQLTFETDRPKRCSYQRAYRMLGAYCVGLNLHVLPTTLKSDIEILDASFNRIRDLRNSTFEWYTSIRFLYLGDNMIQNIESLAFEPLTSLEVLDLSINALTTIPYSVLNLISLRKLYMTDNSLTNIHSDLAQYEKPFKAPLSFLNLAYCHLNSMPDFGVLSELEHLNVSGNRFFELRPMDFAKLCSIKFIDLNESYFSKDSCEVQLLVSWFEEHQIEAVPLTVYATDNNSNTGVFLAQNCPTGYDEVTTKTHAECKAAVKTNQLSKSVKKTWITIGASVGGFLFAFMVLLYWLHRRNVKQMKGTNKNQNSAIANNDPSRNANALLSDSV